MKRPDYRTLQALDAVIRERGFERAAQKLCITQSAVSQRIKQLENMFGQPLLVRTVPPRPTEQGQKLLALLRQVELLEDHAHVVADDFGLVLVGQLLTVDVDVAAGRLFQKVHAADGGRFAAAGRSDNDQLFALGDLEVHVFEDVQVSEVLVNVFEFDHCDPRLSLSCSVVRAPAPRTAHPVRLSRTAHKNEKTKKAQSESIHLSAFAFVG